MPTYTSSSLFVENGDVTSHDTDTVESDITISNAECRWKGVDTSSTSTDTEININTSSNSGSAKEGDANSTVTTFTQFPAVESGYTFTQHRYDFIIQNNNDYPVDVTWYPYIEGETRLGTYTNTVEANNSAGRSAQITETEQDTSTDFVVQVVDSQNEQISITLEVETWGDKEITTTESTEDPFVTRDVDGSFTGTLADGEWSSWVPLNDFSDGYEEFYHNISGSEDAYFEFRYDYESQIPDPIHELRFGDPTTSTVYRVALTNPSNSKLDYDHVRVGANGSVYALDVVDPSDPNAIDAIRIGTQYGTLCLRAFDTV